MADSRSIGDLTALGAEPASGDGIVVWDDSARLTKLRAYSSFQADVQASLSGVLGITNALSLLSLRQVNPTYRGYCVRLRRISDMAEKDFGFADGLVDTASISTWAGGASLRLVRWYDQGWNGRHAAQSTQSAQPTFIVADSGDGLPRIGFDGTNDFLPTGSISADQKTVHILTVFNPGASTSARIIDADAAGEAGIRWTTGNAMFCYADGAQVGSAATVASGAFSQHSLLFQPGAGHWRSAGAVKTTWTDGYPDPGVNFLTLGAQAGGAASWAAVSFREFLVYTTALESDAEAALESEQMDYWL